MRWKVVNGYPNYSVSDTGIIKRNTYKRIDSVGRVTNVDEKILKPYINKDGYKMVMLFNNKQRKAISVHRLVAIHFIENIDNQPCINHKDEDKLNNNYDNLEWCSVAYNNNYGTRQEKVSKTQGKKVIGTNGKETLVFNSANQASIYMTGKKCSNISECCNGKFKQVYGYQWRWV